MYAIVEITGKQFKVNQDQYIYTAKIDQALGASISFDKVLLLEDEKSLQVGAPLVKGVTIQGQIIEHVKGNKIIVFKRKRRKGYKVKQGHRQGYTKVLIKQILQ
jgi:large subunit ribosomal protein L21